MDRSMYDLITELCDKHIDKRKCVYENINIQQTIKKFRANAYEILLKKQHISECVNELKDNTDPICHLLAWQYTLKNQLNQPEKAATLGVFINHLKNNEILQDFVVQNVILFLLHLRGSCPQNDDTKWQNNLFDKVNLKHKTYSESSTLPYDIYHQNKFHFPTAEPLNNQKTLTTFPLRSFTSEPCLNISLCKKPSRNIEPVLKYSSHYKFDPISCQFRKPIRREIKIDKIDEGYHSPVKENNENIWEMVSKMPINKHRTWETLDDIDPKKELPFASESGPKTLHLFQKILKANCFNGLNEEYIEETIIPHVDFIKFVKYMLVGMTSKIFSTNDYDVFYLKNGICLEGISNKSLNSYCQDLLYCGSCYRSLNNLCSPISYKNNENDGYIFKELCESVKRYLAYYRVAALSFSDKSDLLLVLSHMRGLRQQIGALAKICRLPPEFPLGYQQLKGAQLLDFIYREISEAVDKNVQLVLYSVFYPCCQIYFSRFLQRWLFEGVLIDPYEEFIIKSETEYTKSRARVYWTRSFSLRQNSVPEFLFDLKIDILQCGKTMNLLKQCNPDASLYTHIMSRSLPLISCCLTPDQSDRLKQEIDCYYVEMSALCGPRISLYHRIRDRYGNEENSVFLNLVEKKRALAFREIELRKQFEAEEKAKLKRKIFEEMQLQMKEALEEKKRQKEDELKQELMFAEQAAQVEELRSKIVKEESNAVVKFYDDLIEASEKRRNSFVVRNQKLLESSINFSDDSDKNEDSVSKISSNTIEISSKTTGISSKTTGISSNTTEISSNEIDLFSVTTGISSKTIEISSKATEISSNTIEISTNTAQKIELDRKDDQNKNIVEENIPRKDLDVENANITNTELINQKNETFIQAKKNRAKVLNLEFGTNKKETKLPSIPIEMRDRSSLTDAQKNKLKVMSSEFDVYYKSFQTIEKIVENNGNVVNNVAIATTSIAPSVVVNSNNLASPGHEDVMNLTHRKKLQKPTELVTIYEKTKKNNDIIPMSVDTTPNTEFSGDLLTPSSAKLSLNTDICLDTPSVLDSALLTGNSCLTDDGFKFPVASTEKIYETTRLLFTNKKIFSITQNLPKNFQPMRVSKKDVQEIKNGNLKSLLYQSVYIPLEAQIQLVNSEIIKYFVNEQNFLSHLHSLRCYYFFFDGEFARSITDSLFSSLYDCKTPKELLSCRSLQLIIENAVHASSKIQENGDKLSFIVRNIPSSFNLSSAEVLDCLSLSYKISWPLNVILPYDTIEKYDVIFKYLLKLQHMSWVLQKISYELKNTQKEIGIDETLLFTSPQYHKIQLYRHIMTHFIQTLQNYTICEVLQTSWDELENNLKTVSTLDQLYAVHVVYVKTIMFRCLLNRKCESIMKVIREIFVTILKFYNYLRSRSWNLRERDIYYTHPNFKKIEMVFNRFEEFTAFVFRVGNKMARVGYQPHLIQMLDMLNVNDYYTSKQKS